MNMALRHNAYWAILSLILTVTCLSCDENSSGADENSSPPAESPVDEDYSAIEERGYITAIMDNSSTGLFLYRGQTMGYEYELLKMFADSMGLELKIKLESNLMKAFEMLNSGEGDVMAYNLTVTKERKKRIAFTHYHNLVRQVLIQRKPENWRKMKLHEIDKQLIRNPVALIGKKVHVRYHSAFLHRLENLSDEIGGKIIIIEDSPDLETETIIGKVARGEIDYTVAEQDIALVHATYYPILDVNTPVSFPQQIAWGVRKNADTLLMKMNRWIVLMRKTPEYYTVYNRYFKSTKASKIRNRSEYSSMGGGKISPYDDLIKAGAEKTGWDWRLLAAQIYKESKFDSAVVSWAGAVGLLQVLPKTSETYGFSNLTNPENNINAGITHLQWLQSIWRNRIRDSLERQKFVLGSYNVGQGHVFDAINLAKKYGADTTSWESVSAFLLKKVDPAYFNDEVVRFGYCRGSEPVAYVRDIMAAYENYLTISPEG